MPPWRSKQCNWHMGLFLSKQETDLKSCLAIVCRFPTKKKINNQRMPKIRNTRQSSGGVLSLQKVWRCFDVREVSKVWWGGLLKLGHKGSHFVKSLSEKHCKKHEAHFLSRKKNSSPVLGRNRLGPLIWWDSLNILEKLMHNECPQIRNKLVSLKTTSEVD